MKKNYLKIILIYLITINFIFLNGCGNSNSRTITIAGSTSLKPLAEEIAMNFMEENENDVINVQGGGSGTGINNVAVGNIEIGMSDVIAEKKLPEDEAKKLVDYKVCVVGFAPVVHSDIKIDSLTKKQLIDIFTGKITNWKELGGDDVDIVILSRPKSSGSREAFKKYALDGNEESVKKSLTGDSSGAIAKTIKETEGAISYLSSSYLINPKNIEGIKILKVDDVEMNKENIINGKYDIWAYEHMYTKREAQGLTKAYLDYINSKKGKEIILKLGYIPTNEMKVKR